MRFTAPRLRTRTNCQARTRWRTVTACLMAIACLTATACGSGSGDPGDPPSGWSPAANGATALWPRFTAPTTILAADATGLRGGDLLAATTLEGVYNAAQHGSRLYLARHTMDRFWLAHLPPGIRVQTISAPPSQSGPTRSGASPSGLVRSSSSPSEASQPGAARSGASGSEASRSEGLVRELLRRLGSAVKGAVVANPANPDTVNLATTLAGLDGAIAIFPAQERLVASLGIPVRYSFDTPAFTAASPTRTYEWGIRHLLPRTSRRVEVALSGTDDGDIRDYAVATKAFVYWLTSTAPAQRPLLEKITRHTPPNTPVLGYLPVENPDVAYISTLGHFLNGSNDVTNESVWASLPSPPFLRQPTEPAPIAARPGTVYVAFLMSDGDNAGFMQSRMAQEWREPALGTVPAGWTVAPGAVEFNPLMLEYYERTLPPDSELDAGPSGIGYVSESSGPDLARFDQLTRDIMARDDLATVDSYEPPGQLAAYAAPSGPGPAEAAGHPAGVARDTPLLPRPAGVSKNTPLLPRQAGDTVVSGQTSGYIDSLASQYCTILLQASAERPGDPPLFLQPMINAYDYGPAELLGMAERLARAGRAAGVHVVFTTPTELAQTMRRYYARQEAGLPAANAQSRTGEQILDRLLATSVLPANAASRTGTSGVAASAGTSGLTGTGKATGPNLVTNPSGASGTAGWNSVGGKVTAVSYRGRPAVHWISHVADGQSWTYYLPRVANGRTYTFSADVAGSGEAYLNVWNGASDENTLPVRLTPGYQRLTWTATIPASASRDQASYAPQLQVREGGAGPVSLYVANASIRQSAPSC